MSSFKNAAKSRQKYHKERAQPASRQHLGILEKKKDYKQRADDHHRKEKTIVALKRKALDKNPDEFYFKMIRTAMVDGEHQSEDKTPKYTDEQLKLIHSQDIRYVGFKRSLEMKKIQKLQSVTHILESSSALGKHTFFVDSKKEAKEFDVAARLNTHPALMDRTFNRPTLDQLKTTLACAAELDPEVLKEMASAKEKVMRELKKRISREKELKIIEEKMQVKKQILDKKSKRKKVQDETVKSAAVYRWCPMRKK